MYQHTHQMEPLRPPAIDTLTALAETVIAKDARLSGKVHPHTKVAAAALVRTMNCYYSNLIEGHKTLPLDIERALKNDFSADQKQADLQHLAAAHVRTARTISARVKAGQSPVDADFICECHRFFYDGMPLSLRTLEDGSLIEPGVFRKQAVIIGRHVPPVWESIPEFMKRFQQAYFANPRALPSSRLVDVAAAHHRLVWIHPFADGNGRVGRLIADVMLLDAGINVDGLWSLSRGFAKGLAVEGGESITYKARLMNADQPRRGPYDGRGNLSTNTLEEFCEYVLSTAIDQIDFMSSMFDFDNLTQRFHNYFERARPDLKIQSAALVKAALAYGEIARGDAGRVTGLHDRVASDVLGQLVAEGFLVSDTPKGPVRVGFPAKSLGWVFPNLFPAGGPDDPGMAQTEIKRNARGQAKRVARSVPTDPDEEEGVGVSRPK